MEERILVYNNLLWDILDQGSKLYIMSLLMENGFEGDCKLVSKIDGDVTIMEVNDNYGHSIVLPINILDILNN